MTPCNDRKVRREAVGPAAEHGQISVADVIRVTQAPRATIKKRLTELTRSRHLNRGGKGRSTWYSLA